jgi:nucleoside-diphosphate-sugar epimerase
MISYSGMRILVLGGTRFMGPFLVRDLAAGGHEVVVFHRGEHEQELPAEHVHGDFADFDQHLPGLLAFEPETVVDMLAVLPTEASRVGAFAGSARHAVVLSSADVYRAFGRAWRTEPGPPDPVPLTEDSPLRKRVVNAKYDKVAVEAAVRQLDLPVTVLRVAAVHGPGDYQHRLWPYLKRMDDGRPTILLDREVAHFYWARVYVENAAHAIALAATNERAGGRTFNVAEAMTLNETEWINAIAASTGWHGPVVAAPSSMLPEYLREDRFDFRQQYVLDTTRIRRELGYRELVGPFDAMHRTVDWERANPPRPEDLHPEFVDRFDYDAEDQALNRISHSTID